MVFTPLSTVFQSYHGDSSYYSCFSWASPVLGWALKCLAQGHSHEKPRGSSATRAQDRWITSQTLHHCATWDPLLIKNYLTSIPPNVCHKGVNYQTQVNSALKEGKKVKN